MVRAGLSMILGGAGDIGVVAEAGDGSEVPPLVAEHRPDVVLMDIRMPGVDGLTATERLRAAPAPSGGPPEVVVLTTFHADAQVLRALRAGAAGFLLKDIPPGDLVAAIRRVASGEPILSPAVTRQLIAHVADGGAGERAERARRLLGRLSEREREVALCVGRGRSNAEIAGELYMSVPTVKAHVSRILTKLDLNNRVQVALLVYDAAP
ncbi:response regulator transcription factor [Actinomadura sp. ATCC 31491]|uniref:Response regulator transcription factor n=2 Tax=Actinomadura luzonensis TaxID=2805427 RepID=A0ABT0G7X6_9ACTN|nr:response regulator transcription factor [Actinomadura luzonensis]